MHAKFGVKYLIFDQDVSKRKSVVLYTGINIAVFCIHDEEEDKELRQKVLQWVLIIF